jgi:hypothetical protein
MADNCEGELGVRAEGQLAKGGGCREGVMVPPTTNSPHVGATFRPRFHHRRLLYWGQSRFPQVHIEG